MWNLFVFKRNEELKKKRKYDRCDTFKQKKKENREIRYDVWNLLQFSKKQTNPEPFFMVKLSQQNNE